MHKFLLLSLFAVFNLTLTSITLADAAKDIQQKIDKQQYGIAVIQIKNQLKEKPKDAQLRYQLGSLYLSVGKKEDSLKELGRAYQYDPKDIKILFRYVDALQASNKADKIIDLLGTKLSDKKQESMRLNYLGVAHLTQKQMADAKILFEQSNLLIKSSISYNGLATIAIMEQEFIPAQELLDTSLALDENNVKTLQIQAKLANITQHPEDALKIYEQLIAIQPNNINYYLERAATLAMLSKNELAMADLNLVLERSPIQPQANYIKAQLLLQAKDYKGAQEAAQNVVNVLPDNIQATFILGASNFALKNYNQAEEYLSLYTSIYPKNLKAQNLLANIYLAKNEPTQSLVILKGLPQHELDNNPLLIITLANSYVQLNERQKSIDILRKAVTNMPDNEALRMHLISIYFKNGNFDSVINELEQVSITPSNTLKQTQTDYLLIISYIKDKQLDKAEEKIKILLKQNPNDAKLLNLQALIKQIKGDFDNAILQYQTVLKDDKNNVTAQMGLARIYVLQSQWEKAHQYFRQIITINPKEYKAHLGLAAISDKKNNPMAVTEKYFLDALEQNKEDIETTLLIANLLTQWYQSKKQPEKVLVLAENLIKKNRNNEKILFFLVKAQMLNKKERQAENTLKKIIYTDRKNIKYRILLVQLIAKDETRIDEAIKLLNEAQDIDPDSLAVYSTREQLLIKKKEYYKALKLAKEIQIKYPDINTGFLFEAQIYYLKKHYKKSLELYQSVYKKNQNKQVLSIIVNLLITIKQYDQAINLLTEEVNKNPDDINNLFRLASLLQEKKQFKKAEIYYQKILKKDPKHVITLNNLSWIIVEKDQKQALKMAEKAYELAPKSMSIVDTYGYFLALDKQYKKSLKLLKIAAEKKPKDNDIQYHLAFLYTKIDKKTEALKILKTLTATEDNFQEKEKALTLYDTIK